MSGIVSGYWSERVRMRFRSKIKLMPKKCGHFADKSVISADEMVGKIKAAVDGRMCEDLLIIARTDALLPKDSRSAVERAQQYIEAGADITFVEAPESIDLMRNIPKRLSVPQVVNVVVGGKTPVLAQTD